MKKIINITFIVSLIAIIILNFINYQNDINDIKILTFDNFNIESIGDDYLKDNNSSIIIDYYFENNEIYNLIINNKYDVAIIPKEYIETLDKNKVLYEIDKAKILNYRNIDEEYMSNDNKYISLTKKDNKLYVMVMLKKNNHKASVFMDYILRGDIMAKLIKDNNFESINWAAKYYMDK